MQNCPRRFSRIGNTCTVSPQCEFLCAPEHGEGKNDDDDDEGPKVEGLECTAGDERDGDVSQDTI